MLRFFDTFPWRHRSRPSIGGLPWLRMASPKIVPLKEVDEGDRVVRAERVVDRFLSPTELSDSFSRTPQTTSRAASVTV